MQKLRLEVCPDASATCIHPFSKCIRIQFLLSKFFRMYDHDFRLKFAGIAMESASKCISHMSWTRFNFASATIHMAKFSRNIWSWISNEFAEIAIESAYGRIRLVYPSYPKLHPDAIHRAGKDHIIQFWFLTKLRRKWIESSSRRIYHVSLPCTKVHQDAILLSKIQAGAIHMSKISHDSLS